MKFLELNSSLPITVIGLMSGTSLDGTDLCACTFSEVNGKWNYKIIAGETIPYSSEWIHTLKHLQDSSAEELISSHAALGRYYGTLINNFVEKHQLKADLISSHGHTIFHQPEKGFTFQLGDGQQIAAICGIDTVSDFRSKDVGLGGQGAPLVPIGDALLFHQYDACLNLGGIANISYDKEGSRIGYDICVANMALNYLAEQMNLRYDDRGEIAANGQIIPIVLEELNTLDFYKTPGPKSLGREWFEKNILPVIKKYPFPEADQLRTLVEHIAIQISSEIKKIKTINSLLVTGGGAYNTFLIDQIKKQSGKEITLPDATTIAYKEAIIFAFLAVLFVNDRVNVLGSATGAPKNHIGGAYCKAD